MALAFVGRNGRPALAGLLVAMVGVSAVAQRPTARDSTRDTTRADSTRARALSAVVITASRRLQRVSDAPVTTEIVSREDVARSGAQDLNGLLTQYVGVQPEPGVIGSGGLQLEGLSSQHVLVLIDGQPMVGRIEGELDASRVPAWMIDHVEVIKGPLSTLYGSAAMGGVINVITRDALFRRPAMAASILGGSQGRFEVNTNVRGAIGDILGTIGAGRRQDDVQPGRADQSGARANRWDATAKGHWSSVAPDGSPRIAVDGALFGVREDQRWQNGQLFNFSNNTQKDARFTTSIPVGGSRLALTGYYSRFDHLSRQATLPEPVSDSGDVSTESLARLEALYTGVLQPGHTIDLGIDADRSALRAARIVGGRRVSSSVEPFAQYTLDAGPLSVVPGARVSASDQWGTHVTPTLATVYRLGDAVVLRASAGAGYRAPEFKELYVDFLNGAVGYVVKGNSTLLPETSTNFTGSVEWAVAHVYARVQGYRNHFTNFIESVQAPDSGGVQQFTYGNIGRGSTRGADIDFGVAYGRTTVDGSFGALSTRDDATGLPLLGATPRSARVTMRLELPHGIHPSLTGFYWSATPESRVTSGFSTTILDRAAFTRFDASVMKAFPSGVDGKIGVMNVFDARPRSWPGETARRWYLGLSIDRGF